MALQVWLPLNGNLNNNGINNVTWSGAPGSWGTSGKIGKCATFAANTNTVITTASTDFYYTDNFSWCMWVYPTWSTGSQYAFTVGRADYGGYGYGLAFVDASTGRIRFGSQSWDVNAPSNQWTHIAFTKSGTSVKIYKNGVLTTDGTFTGTAPTYSDANGLCIGAFKYSGGTIYPYNGSINDFRLYSRALAPKEIEILSRGLVCHYPLNGGGRGGDNLLKNTGDLTLWAKEAGITTTWDSEKNLYKIVDSTHTSSRWGIYQDINIEANTSYTITCTLNGDNCAVAFGFYDSSTSFPGNLITVTDSTTKRLSYTVTSGASSTKARVYLNMNCANSATKTAWFGTPKVEKGSVSTPWIPNSADAAYTAMGYNSTTEYDVSGYGYNGTKNGTFTYLTDTARYNVSTKFADTTYIETSSPCSNVRSASFWIKTDKTAYRVAWADAKSKLAFGIVTAGDILISCNGGYTKKYPNSVIAANVWQHIVIVRGEDIANTDLYVNGVKQSPGTSTDYWSHTSDTLIINGRGYSTPSRMNSQMSDFRLYATALSATQVAELYNTAVSVANNGTLMGYELVEG